MIPPEKLVYADSWDDDRPGKRAGRRDRDLRGYRRADAYDQPPRCSRTVIHLERVRAMGVEAGWALFLDRLAAQVADMATRSGFGKEKTMRQHSVSGARNRTGHHHDPFLRRAAGPGLAGLHPSPNTSSTGWGPDGFTIEHESSDFRVGRALEIRHDRAGWHALAELPPVHRY